MNADVWRPFVTGVQLAGSTARGSRSRRGRSTWWTLRRVSAEGLTDVRANACITPRTMRNSPCWGPVLSTHPSARALGFLNLFAGPSLLRRPARRPLEVRCEQLVDLAADIPSLLPIRLLLVDQALDPLSQCVKAEPVVRVPLPAPQHEFVERVRALCSKRE